MIDIAGDLPVILLEILVCSILHSSIVKNLYCFKTQSRSDNIFQNIGPAQACLIEGLF